MNITEYNLPLNDKESAALINFLTRWFNTQNTNDKNFYNRDAVAKLIKEKLKQKGNWRRSPDKAKRKKKKTAEEELMENW